MVKAVERAVLNIKLDRSYSQCQDPKSNEGQERWKSHSRTKVELGRAWHGDQVTGGVRL